MDEETILRLLAETDTAVTVVRPGDTLVIQVPYDSTAERVEEYQRVIQAAADSGLIPFPVLVLPAAGLAVIQGNDPAGGDGP